MSFDEESLRKLWIRRYGGKQWVRDCYGYWINYFDHGRECKKRITPDERLEDCGWEIDHIMPESKGGSSYESNLEFVYHSCNETKADKLVYELFNGKTYEIRKRFNKLGFGIYSKSSGKNIDWFSNH